MSDETYGEARRRNLEALLRTLAERIRELDAAGALLSRTNELMDLIGDVRTELFHYEVRATYDTPEVAENRRIVADAVADEAQWDATGWTPDNKDGGDEDKDKDDHHHHAPTPEPSTIFSFGAAILIGGGVLYSRRLRKKSN